MHSLVVIPECNRPPVEQGGEIRHDHLSIAYIQIIRDNIRVRSCLATKNECAIEAEIAALYFKIVHLMTNSDGRFKLHKDSPASTVGNRLSGKEGLCRGYAQGKRGNNCARSVIGPEVIPFGSVSLPGVLRAVTIPERVNRFNIHRIRRIAKCGEVIHLTPHSGEHKYERRRYAKLAADAKAAGKEIPEIKIGDLVHRISGQSDDAIINRQPTLHRHSMIGVRPIYQRLRKTIGLHMSYTSPMNADFDGDEANALFPQTNRARSETRHLLGAANQLISSQNSSPCMGLVFNCPTAAFLISRDADHDEAAATPPPPVVTEAEWNELIATLLEDRSRADTLDARLARNKVPLRGPRALLSLAFPQDLYYYREYQEDGGEEIDPVTGKVLLDDNGDPRIIENRRHILIRDGVFIAGTLTKTDVANGIIHAIHLKYGAAITGRFITEAHYLLDWYYERRGFSIGLYDCLLTDRTAARKAVSTAISRVRNEIDAMLSDKIRNDADAQFREIEIRSKLQSVTKVGIRLTRSTIAGANNPLGTMITAGAKGTHTNMAQIGGLLGQQFVKGSRPDTKLHGGRASPYFEAGSKSLESRGFIPQSFADGTRPSGFIFHMSAVRIGLIDTSINTAEVGATYYRCQRMLENDSLNYHGAVATAGRSLTSLSYGEGYSPTELVMVRGFVTTGDMFMPMDIGKVCRELNAEFSDSDDDGEDSGDGAGVRIDADNLVGVVPSLSARGC